MNTSQLLTLLAVGLLVSSCKQGVENNAYGELKSKNDYLYKAVNAKDTKIEDLETKVESVQISYAELCSSNEKLQKTINAKITKLEAEVKAAESVLREIKKEAEALKKQEQQRVLQLLTGKGDAPFCGNGPWETWDERSKKANATIALNTAMIRELKSIAASVEAITRDK